MEKFTNTTKNIYDHLQDRQSKFFFENRLLYTLTGDYQYIQRIIAVLSQKKELDRAIEFCKSQTNNVVIYGAGNDLSILSDLYPDFPIRLICDSSQAKQKAGWRGIPVMSPDELIKIKNNIYVAINTSAYHKEIAQFLGKNGFPKERIINLGAITDALYSRQYFDRDIMVPRSGEVFVDGGCFNCNTDREFVKWCSGNYEKIYAFEPDPANYQYCLKQCEKEEIRNIEIYDKGLWDKEAELSFEETGGQGSKIGEGTAVISATSIDTVAGDHPISFIKLDVEGAELRALQGAERIICRDHPRMAVCVYHKPQDIIEIPEYILKLDDRYKLYIRHYQMSPCETVVYAL